MKESPVVETAVPSRPVLFVLVFLFAFAVIVVAAALGVV